MNPHEGPPSGLTSASQRTVGGALVAFFAAILPMTAAAQDVTAAAKAFSAGQQAELAREWARAAEFYELADRIAPSPQALRSAAKDHLAAGDQAAAATQAEELLRRYPDDASSISLATGILQQTSTHLTRWDIACTPACTVAVDGAAVVTEPRRDHKVYLDPGEHQMEAFFAGNRGTVHTVSGLEGAHKQVVFELPATESAGKPEVPAAAQVSSAGRPGDVPAAPERPAATEEPSGATGGFPRSITYGGLCLTAVLGAATVWSGLDTLHARDDYQRQPTRRGYDDGVGRELRTNVLIGATAVSGAATLAVALFLTRWTSAPATKEKASAVGRRAFPVTLATTGRDARLLLQGSF